MKSLFITGTDTEVGKTFVTCCLMQALTAQGFKVAGLKPIASGADWVDGQLKNSDALALMEQSNVAKAEPYSCFNPNAYAPAIAPHIAAKHSEQPICFNKIEQSMATLASYHPDFLLIEGAGGWRLPVSDSSFLSDWVVSQQLSVVLVVGMRLGCINHALLTAQAIQNDGLHIAGWVANCVDESMPHQAENIDLLIKHIHAPLLGVVPYSTDSSTLHTLFDIESLK